MKQIVIIILGLILVYSCSKIRPTRQIGESIVGSWNYFGPDSNYIETYIDFENIIFFSAEDGYTGPFNYTLNKNKLQFNDIEYNIVIKSDDKIEFGNDRFKLKLRKINCIQTTNGSQDEISPYHLRRCTEYVNIGRMTVSDAIKYMNTINLLEGECIGDELFLEIL